jgi:hypothetical protein
MAFFSSSSDSSSSFSFQGEIFDRIQTGSIFDDFGWIRRDGVDDTPSAPDSMATSVQSDDIEANAVISPSPFPGLSVPTTTTCDPAKSDAILAGRGTHTVTQVFCEQKMQLTLPEGSKLCIAENGGVRCFVNVTATEEDLDLDCCSVGDDNELPSGVLDGRNGQRQKNHRETAEVKQRVAEEYRRARADDADADVIVDITVPPHVVLPLPLAGVEQCKQRAFAPPAPVILPIEPMVRLEIYSGNQASFFGHHRATVTVPFSMTLRNACKEFLMPRTSYLFSAFFDEWYSVSEDIPVGAYCTKQLRVNYTAVEGREDLLDQFLLVSSIKLLRYYASKSPNQLVQPFAVVVCCTLIPRDTMQLQRRFAFVAHKDTNISALYCCIKGIVTTNMAEDSYAGKIKFAPVKNEHITRHVLKKFGTLAPECFMYWEFRHFLRGGEDESAAVVPAVVTAEEKTTTVTTTITTTTAAYGKAPKTTKTVQTRSATTKKGPGSGNYARKPRKSAVL